MASLLELSKSLGVCVSGGISVSTTECLNRSTNAWEIIPSLSMTDSSSMTALNFGSVSCLVGGNRLANVLTNVICTNSSNPYWITAPPIPSGRYGASAIYGTNWVGITSGTNTSFLNATLNWTNMPIPISNWSVSAMAERQYTTVVNLNGTPCMSAGYNGLIFLSTSSCLVQGTWISGPNLTTARYAASPLLLHGRWCLAGGYNGAVLSTIECIGTTANFRATNYSIAKPGLPRPYCCGTNLTINGLPCLAGGIDDSKTLSTVLCANVSVDNTIQWLPMPSLNTPRWNPISWALDAPSPTSSPTSPTSSPTSFAPTQTPSFALESKLSGGLTSGETAGIAISLLLLLLGVITFCLCWIRKDKKLKLLAKIKGESLPRDPRQVALDGTIKLCEQVLKESKISTQTKLYIQAAIVGAREHEQTLSQLGLKSGVEMTNFMMTKQSQRQGSKVFNMEEFEHVAFISQGEGGTAELYKDKSTNNQVVIKVPHHVKELEAEAKVWCSIGLHPNVARMIGIVNLNNKPRGIVMEYYPGGSLNHTTQEFSPKELHRIAIDLARGLQCLHEHKVIHRDLAARNILMARDRRVAITDFGMSRQLDENDTYRMMSDAKLPWRTLAPELLLVDDQARVFTEKTDVWALGVTLWELATKQSAYAGTTDKEGFQVLKQKIGSGIIKLDLTPIIIDHPHIATALVGCFNRDPALRPNAEQLRWLLKDDYSAEMADRTTYATAVQVGEYA